MAKKIADKTLQIMNTELVALLEYAKLNNIEVNVDDLMAALQPLIHAEISAKYEKNADVKESKSDQGAEQNRKLAMQSDADKKKAMAARHNMNSPMVQRQVENMLAGYLMDNGSAESQLLKNGGSLLSLYTLAKQDKSDEVVNTLGVTEEIKDKHAYFVPNVIVNTYMHRNHIDDFAKAANEVQNKNAIVCNFLLDQQTQSGDWYIGGGAEGLKVLLGEDEMPGKQRVAGILDVCGVEPKLRDLVVLHKGKGSTKYGIVLDQENGKKFQEEITNPRSLLRSKYVTLTDMAQTITRSTDSQFGGSADGDENPAGDKGQADLVKGQQGWADNLTNNTSTVLRDIQQSITGVYNAVARYIAISSSDSRMPKISNVPHVETNEKDPHQFILDEFSAISESARDFCATLGVDLPMVHGKSGSYSVDVVEFGAQPYNKVLKIIMQRYGSVKNIAAHLTKLAGAYNACLWNVKHKITAILDQMKFGVSGDDGEELQTDNEVARARDTRTKLMEKQYRTVDGKKFTLNAMMNNVPDSVLTGTFDDDEVPVQYNEDFSKAFKQANQIEVSLSKGVPVSDEEIGANCNRLAEMLVNHLNDSIRLQNLMPLLKSVDMSARAAFGRVYSKMRNMVASYTPIPYDMWIRELRKLFGDNQTVLKSVLGSTQEADAEEPEQVESPEPEPTQVKAPVEQSSKPDQSSDDRDRRVLSLSDDDEDEDIADMTISRI